MATYVIDFETVANVTDHFDILNPDGTTVLGTGSQQRKFNRASGQTGSTGVGPSSAQAGTFYCFIEASTPTAANDVGTLTFKLPVGEKLDSIDVYTNRRGNTMADFDIEVLQSGSWSSVLNLTGVDIATGASGTATNDVWQLQNHTFLPTEENLRLVWTFPSTGTIWNCDQGADSITIVTSDLVASTITGVTRDFNGTIVPSTEVILFRQQSGEFIEDDRLVSGVDGSFTFNMFDNIPRMLWARKDGVNFGCTTDLITPS